MSDSSNIIFCLNCGKIGHVKADCWSPGGDKEGQRPKSKRNRGGKRKTNVVDEHPFFTFDYPQFALKPGDPPNMRVEVYSSSASSHVSPYRTSFINFREISPRTITTATSLVFQATGIGDMHVEVPLNGRMTPLLLGDVLYAPKVSCNIVSIGRFTSEGYAFAFSREGCEIIHPQRRVIGLIPFLSDLPAVRRLSKSTSEADLGRGPVSIMDLHRMLGHIPPRSIRKLIDDGSITGIQLDKASKERPCTDCAQLNKMRKELQSERTSNRVGQLIHSDIWGPAPVDDSYHPHYFVSFTDDSTRITRVYLMKTKSETFEMYKRYESWMKTQMDVSIKALQFDRTGSYMTAEFCAHLKSQGTEHYLTVHDSPNEHGVAELLNPALIEHARIMLIESGLPKSLWGQALQYAVWLMNRTHTGALEDKTPYEAIVGEKPNLSKLRVWGMKVSVTCDELCVENGTTAYFVGKDTESDGFCVYWPDSRHVSVERNVLFPAAESQSSPAGRNQAIDSLQDFEDVSNDRATGGTACIATAFDNDRISQVIPAYEEIAFKGELTSRDWAMIFSCAGDVEGAEPRDIQDAMDRTEWPRWKGAIKAELDLLNRADAWELTKRPEGANVLGSRWVFRHKRKADGSIDHYQARLSAQEFTQIRFLDYQDAFVPVAKFTSIRIILALAARNNWPLHKMDVKGAYLQADLEKEVYMTQPPGFAVSGKEHLVCRLKKPIHGLSQSGRQWHKKMIQTMTSLGYKKCETDNAVFHKEINRERTIVAVNTEDMAILASSDDTMSRAKYELKTKYEMVDKGSLTGLLGIEIKRDRAARTISLSQRAYLDTIISRFNMHGAHPADTPMDPGLKLSSAQCPSKWDEVEDMREVPYRELIGSLMNISLASRPDITFAVTVLSQFMQNPGRPHWNAAKRVIRYLKGTREMWLTLGGTYALLEGSISAAWKSQDDYRSMSGYAFLLFGGAISWSSNKQSSVALSSREAHYVSMSHAANEAVRLRKFLAEIYCPLRLPTTLVCDSRPAMKMAGNRSFYDCIKHIDIKHHFIREAVENGSVKLVHRKDRRAASALLAEGQSLDVRLENLELGDDETESSVENPEIYFLPSLTALLNGGLI